MILKLLDYNSDEVEFEIGELEDIASIDIQVVSGDEIATVFYKNGSSDSFDSSTDRWMDFDDDNYTLYDADAGINRMVDTRWLARSSSYDIPDFNEE